MKKLFAISVVFALLTGAAFAQITFSAESWAGATLMWDSTDEAHKGGPFASPGLWGEDEDDYWQHFGASMTASYETDGGEAGVSFTIKTDGGQKDNDDQGTNPNALIDFGGAWWYIVPELLKLNFGAAGFDRGDPTPFHYDAGSGNWFGISVYPVDMLTLNIALIDENRWGDKNSHEKPKDNYGTGELGDNLANVIMLQAIAAVDGIGEFGFTFDNWYDNNPVRGIFLDYNGEWYGVGVDLGFAYFMGVKDYVEGFDPDDPDAYDMNKWNMWGVGLGLSYTIMDIKLGMNFDIYQESYDGKPTHDPKGGIIMDLGFNVGYVVPVDPFSIDLAASVDLKNLSGEKGVGLQTYDADLDEWLYKGDMLLNWEVNIALLRDIGGFNFKLGFDLSGSNVEKSGVNYAVPIKFSYSF